MLQMRQMVMARRICAILEELASLCRAQASPHASSGDADHMRENHVLSPPAKPSVLGVCCLLEESIYMMAAAPVDIEDSGNEHFLTWHNAK